MLSYLMVINFSETVIYEGPSANRTKLREEIQFSKTSCLANCHQPNYRYTEFVQPKAHKYRLFAKTNDDNTIVALLVDASTNKEAKYWKVIERTFEVLSDFDMETVDSRMIAPEIEEIINEGNKEDAVDKINSSLSRQTEKVGALIEEQKIRTRGLSDLDKQVSALELMTQETVDGSNQLKKEAWWRNMKMQVFVFFGIGIVALLFCLYLLNLFK